jgi:hypothetical protein
MAPDPVRYRLWTPGAAEPAEGAEGRLAVGTDGVTLTSPAGLPLRIPYRDLASVEMGDHLLTLRLASGEAIELSRLGKRFDAVAGELAAARRTHLDASLLLEEEGAGEEDRGAFRRRAADGSPGPERACTLRPQRTSLAVLCEDERPFVVPYGVVKDVTFDASAYAVVLPLWSGGAIELLRLGKRTEAVRRGLAERVSALADRHARALQALAPDLPALRIRALSAVLRDGVPASRGAVEAAAAGAWGAIVARSFAGGRRPYSEHLEGRAERRWLCIKEVTAAGPAEAPGDEGAPEEEQAGSPGATLPPECEGRRLLFAHQIGEALVLEAPGSEDVATYVFRAGPDPAARVEVLCRAFAAVQFRREPFYLGDEALASGAGARHREVVRLVPEVREARAAFTGRAVHTSLDAWRKALEAALARVEG